MPQPGQKRQFKTLLIDPQMQKEYTLLLVILIIAAVIVIAFIVNWTISSAMKDAYTYKRISPAEVMSTINYLLMVRITITLLCTVLVAGFLSIKFLHRVGGPIYRFRMTLKQLSAGNIPNDVKLRRNDFYKDVAEEMNKVLALLRNKHGKALELAKELEKVSSDSLPKEISKDLSRMIVELKKI